MVRKRKKKSGGFRRRALKSARARKARALRLRVNSYTAERVPLTRDGYDRWGKYFGTGQKLYFVEGKGSFSSVASDQGEDLFGYVRANSAKEAKEEALTRPHHWGMRHDKSNR